MVQGVSLGGGGHPSSRQKADALAVSRAGGALGSIPPWRTALPFLPPQGEAAPLHSTPGLAWVRCLQFHSPFKRGGEAWRA